MPRITGKAPIIRTPQSGVLFELTRLLVENRAIFLPAHGGSLEHHFRFAKVDDTLSIVVVLKNIRENIIMDGPEVKKHGEKVSGEETERSERKDYISENDLNEALFRLEQTYKTIARYGKGEGRITPQMIEENLEHSKRVLDFARMIGAGEEKEGRLEGNAYARSQFTKKLQMAAIFHDVAKLDPAYPDGINTFGHHHSGASATGVILREQMNIDASAAREIERAINCHGHIPFILRENRNVPAPETPLDFALRDADLLDQIDIGGLKKIVEIRQNPVSQFFEKDRGDIWKAIDSALKSAAEAKSLLYTKTAQKIAEQLEPRLQKFVAFLKQKNVKNVDDFEKAFEKFVGAE